MEDLIENLRDVEGVQNVKRESGPVLKINLFSSEIPSSEVEKISGDLRKISQKILNRLERASSTGAVSGWEWIIKPEKKYSQKKLGNSRVSDRKPKGHEPAYYRVAINP